MSSVPEAADRFTGAATVDEPGRHELDVEAWVDHFASWREELRRKHAAGQTRLTSELAEGAALVGERLATLPPDLHGEVSGALAAMRGGVPDGIAAALDTSLLDAMSATEARSEAVRLPEPIVVDVDRPRARFGTWYELFPRSFGGFAGVERQLERLAELGVDVLYLTPIHPIGTTHRKGPNNDEHAGPDDPGSPWAIGSEIGGHTAIHPELGTIDDFDRLVASAARHDIDIALDIAIQCSPDHPWLTEHPEWFHRRPDGTLKYAENPPKRYQDIYNVNFDSPDWVGLWRAIRDVFLYWVEHGVRVFRVDNPHTKPFAFWEWCIREVRAREPGTIFLAEAFTRPAIMAELAKLGFSQSYSYFTWKNSKAELTEYLTELAGAHREFFRPNFFTNTPDILHEYLQTGGPAAFEARLVLAATLSPSYGIYSGYEHFENTPVRPGSEEYLDSEKYEVKKRRLDGPLLNLYGRLNAIRRAHPALQHIGPLQFVETHNEHLIAYVKSDGGDRILTVVSLDPRSPAEGLVDVPADLGLPASFHAHDLLDGERYRWSLGQNYVRLGPDAAMAHVLELST